MYIRTNNVIWIQGFDVEMMKGATVELVDIIRDSTYRSGYKCAIKWDGNNMTPTHRGRFFKRRIKIEPIYYVDIGFFDKNDIDIFERLLKIKKIKL